MPNHYKAIKNTVLSDHSSIYQPTHMIPNSVVLDDPAINVMTDLEKVTPISVSPSASVEQANEKMMLCGVRLLFVMENPKTLLGLVTTTDIFGEKPLTYLQEHGGHFRDVQVSDIMTRRENLEAIALRDILRASVGDIVETLRMARRQHILVAENMHDSEAQYVRGIISSTQVERQLGFEIPHLYQAQNFAELERALVSN